MFPLIKDTKHAYCGPTAVGLLTGVPVSRVEAMLRRRRARRWKGNGRDSLGRKLPIRGTYAVECIAVLKRLGCKVTELSLSQAQRQRTLGEFVHDMQFVGEILVQVTGHFMTVNGLRVFDSGSPEGVDIGEYRRRQRRVRRAWKVAAPAAPKFLDGEPLAATRPRKPKPDVKVVRAAKLAAAVKRWERKEKLAKTKLKKLRSQLKRYQRMGLVDA